MKILNVFKFKIIKTNSQKGFTLIELLIVAAIIGILLAIAIPNLIKARISANEANARKALQTLRDAEYEYFEQDLNNDGDRNFTAFINVGSGGSLLDPDGDGTVIDEDTLVDNSFIAAVVAGATSDCPDPKGGYCVMFSNDPSLVDTPSDGMNDFGWEASPKTVKVVGRRDFSVFSDKNLRCTVSTKASGEAGTFDSSRSDRDCD